MIRNHTITKNTDGDNARFRRLAVDELIATPGAVALKDIIEATTDADLIFWDKNNWSTGGLQYLNIENLIKASSGELLISEAVTLSFAGMRKMYDATDDGLAKIVALTYDSVEDKNSTSLIQGIGQNDILRWDTGVGWVAGNYTGGDTANPGFEFAIPEAGLYATGVSGDPPHAIGFSHSANDLGYVQYHPDGNVAFGTDSNAANPYSGNVAIGASATIAPTMTHGVALGALSDVLNTGGVAVGYDTAAALQGVAIGDTAKNIAPAAVTIGVQSGERFTTSLAAVSLGSVAHATATSVAIGFGAQTGQSTVDVPPDGVDAASAIAMGTAAKAKDTYSIALGHQAEALNQDGIAIGRATANGANSIAMGNGSTTNTDSSVAILGDTTGGSNAVAIGTTVASANSVGILGSIGTTSGSCVSIGANTSVAATNSVAIRGTIGASGNAITIMGSTSALGAGGQIAIGNASSTSGTGALAIGDGAQATAANAVALGSGMIATVSDSFLVRRRQVNNSTSVTLAGWFGNELTSLANAIDTRTPTIGNIGGTVPFTPASVQEMYFSVRDMVILMGSLTLNNLSMASGALGSFSISVPFTPIAALRSFTIGGTVVDAASKHVSLGGRAFYTGGGATTILIYFTNSNNGTDYAATTGYLSYTICYQRA